MKGGGRDNLEDFYYNYRTIYVREKEKRAIIIIYVENYVDMFVLLVGLISKDVIV